ncbi:hypothetical protein Cgig2_033256 [Carnegiea gigantea]|uniref:Cyclin n=1 Tax=Carnegiea gigantea TaxID=171969 RepID=A0A9Q1KWV2_9CARY|nr:hypothetical protein Cgig2_033256 [Carnegiea gigantea]
MYQNPSPSKPEGLRLCAKIPIPIPCVKLIERLGSMAKKTITFISSLLERVAESNDLKRGSPTQKASAFDGLSLPTISIRSYLERIFKFANCSPCCFLIACVYLDRFAQRHPLLPINSYNLHRLLITSVMLAAKFMDDVHHNNAHYAKIGGISTTEMNFLEVDFLYGLEFHLNVTLSTFDTYYSYLQKEMFIFEPPLDVVVVSDSSFIVDKSVKLIHSYFNEDETSSHPPHQQLAV